MFDLELENGLINVMDDWNHYTYSFFPSSEIKKDIPMKFYQKPIYNYKLECDNEPGRDITTAM